MKKLLLLVAILIPAHAFALPCAQGAGVFTNGDTIATFEQNCGRPASTSQSSKTVPVAEKWVYYKQDPTQTGNNIKMTILFRNNALQNITTKGNTQNCTAPQQALSGTLTNVTCSSNEVSITSTPLCGQMIQIGSSEQDVQSICGNPATREVTETRTIAITTLQYSNQSPSIFIFADGALTNWQ